MTPRHQKPRLQFPALVLAVAVGVTVFFFFSLSSKISSNVVVHHVLLFLFLTLFVLFEISLLFWHKPGRVEAGRCSVSLGELE